MAQPITTSKRSGDYVASYIANKGIGGEGMTTTSSLPLAPGVNEPLARGQQGRNYTYKTQNLAQNVHTGANQASAAASMAVTTAQNKFDNESYAQALLNNNVANLLPQEGAMSMIGKMGELEREKFVLDIASSKKVIGTGSPDLAQYQVTNELNSQLA